MTAMRVISLLAGILLIIAGFMLIDTPLLNVVELSIFIVISMIVAGIAEVIMFLTSSNKKRDWWLLVSGLIALLLGVWAMLGRGNILAVSFTLSIFFAAWMLVAGIMRIVGSIKLKGIGVGSWWLILIIGILAAILGAYLLFHTAEAALTLGFLIPFVFIYQGVSAVIQFFTIKA